MSFKCITFVSIALFNNSFEINNLYHLLPIVVIKGFKFKLKHQIPFFGIDNCIVSIIPKTNMGYSNRGVRTICDNDVGDDVKPLDNAIGIDFQCMGKNLHIKISSSGECQSKIHITGTKELVSSEYAIRELIKYINDTDLAWRPLFLLDKQSRYTLICDFVSRIQKLDGTFLLYNTEDMNKVIADLVKNNCEFSTVYDFLARYTLEAKNINQLWDKYIKIISINAGANSLFYHQQSINFYGLDISLGAYTMDIGVKNISLSYLSFILLNDQELVADLYSLEYQNIKRNRITLMAPVKDYVPKRGYDKSSKIVAYLFHIYVTGNIKIFSSAPQDMVYNESMRLYKKIWNIINTKDYYNYINGISQESGANQNYSLQYYSQYVSSDNNDKKQDENFSGTIMFEF